MTTTTTSFLPMSEAQLQAAVIDTAHTFGWLVHHVKPARTPDGKYLTRIAGDPGFPDLVLARNGRVIFAELKSDRGRLSAHQQAWLDHLEPPMGGIESDHEVYVWRPQDWTTGHITEMLR